MLKHLKNKTATRTIKSSLVPIVKRHVVLYYFLSLNKAIISDNETTPIGFELLSTTHTYIRQFVFISYSMHFFFQRHCHHLIYMSIWRARDYHPFSLHFL